MKKSVYSLVLMDDVIKAVDQQAYRLGTSRSNLINQILAEHLSCVTPEMRMREIFGQVAELVSSSFCVQEQRSPSLMTVRTALEYKYRPTINYKVELERAPAEYLGTLRVSIRTQSAALIDMFHSFFAYRAKLENAYLSRLGYLNSCKESCRRIGKLFESHGFFVAAGGKLFKPHIACGDDRHLRTGEKRVQRDKYYLQNYLP